MKEKGTLCSTTKSLTAVY